MLLSPDINLVNQNSSALFYQALPAVSQAASPSKIVESTREEAGNAARLCQYLYILAYCVCSEASVLLFPATRAAFNNKGKELDSGEYGATGGQWMECYEARLDPVFPNDVIPWSEVKAAVLAKIRQ